jgi:hypothetical protein
LRKHDGGRVLGQPCFRSYPTVTTWFALKGRDWFARWPHRSTRRRAAVARRQCSTSSGSGLLPAVGLLHFPEWRQTSRGGACPVCLSPEAMLLLPMPAVCVARSPVPPVSRCVVLVPASGPIEPSCEDALRELERRGYPVWRVGGYAAIDAARNQMATDALAQGFHELMWIDADVVFDPDDVDKLRAHGLPLVCGLYAKKSRRELACAFLPGTRQVLFGPNGGVIDMLYCGFGFVLTRRELYETMQRQLRLPVCNRRFKSCMVPYFAPLVAGEGEDAWYLAEDYAFCERARQCGFRVLADLTIRLWHVGTYRFSWEDAGSDKERYAHYTFHLPAPDQPPSAS